MRHVSVIGIGVGDPEHMTHQATRALNAVDVFLIPDKGEEKSDLRRARLDLCRRLIEGPFRTVEIAMPARDGTRTDYDGSVSVWHGHIADAYELALAALPATDRVGFLVWGDPSLYDSTLRILDDLGRRGLALLVEVVPGITAVQALCARHGIAMNDIGAPVLITPGRKLGVHFPSYAGSVVVMLDGDAAFARVKDEGLEIFWGAYLGTKDEILIAGPLCEVKARIVETRAAARAAKGWIMDTYLLRRAR